MAGRVINFISTISSIRQGLWFNFNRIDPHSVGLDTGRSCIAYYFEQVEIGNEKIEKRVKKQEERK